MLKGRFSGVLVLTLVAVLGILIGSRVPIFGQPGRIAGTYKLALSTAAGPLDVLATASSDGIIVGTPVPIAECLPPGYSLSSGYGSWGVGLGTVRFQVRSLLLQAGVPVGEVSLIGTGNAASKTGHGVLHVPQANVPAQIQSCAFRGPFTFTSTPIGSGE